VDTGINTPLETPALEVPPVETPPAPRPTLELAVIPDASDYYRLLGCDRMATFDQIQIGFFRKLRSVLLGTQPLTRDSKQLLRAVCIAHDVLKEPTTRTDYDFRQLGVRDDNQVQTPEDARPAGFGARTHIKIGELLQCAQILEASELEIAVDMHKAMPEMRFGEFLVKQGFLERRQLEAALLGQYLISNGKITVAQYQVGMYNERNSSVPLAETVTSAGWVTDEDLQAYQQPALPNTTTLIPPMPPPVVRPSQEQPIPTQLSAASAVPSWAGNIWGDDEAKEEGVPPAVQAQANEAASIPALPGSAEEAQQLPESSEEDQTKTRPIPVIVNEPVTPPHEETKKGRKQRGRTRDLQPLTGGLTEESGSNSKKRRGNKAAKPTVNPNEFEPIIGQLQEETREEDRD
jgi:hypothetical protein